MKLDDRDAARFWRKVDKSGGAEACWPWTAGRDAGGYGQFRLTDKLQRASRVAVILSGRAIPAGSCVCHACDNPRCCNPSHLWVGTQAENLRDRDAKGRAVIGKALMARRRSYAGEGHPNAKLTDSAIRAIRAAVALGAQTQREIAAMWGVDRSTVSQIARGVAWGHVGQIGGAHHG